MKNKTDIIPVWCKDIGLWFCCLLWTLNLHVNLVYSQHKTGETITNTSNLNVNGLSEKVSLITDKDFYLIGETLHFSFITYDEFLKTRLNLSRVLYVELLSSDNEIVDQVKVDIINGIGSGNLQISKQIPSSTYYLRAYTNYMKNFGLKQFFITPVSIFNPVLVGKQNKNEEFNKINKQSIEMFPEGGHLVPNQLNSLVFRVAGFDGNATSGQLKIMTLNEQVLIETPIDEFGFGTCKFNPGNSILALIFENHL